MTDIRLSFAIKSHRFQTEQSGTLMADPISPDANANMLLVMSGGNQPGSDTELQEEVQE
jgi:ligand-binding SRPBCC domain-containing protein